MTQLRNISLAKHRKMWDSHWTLNHCLINHMQYFPSFELKLPSFRRTSSVDDQLIFFYHQSFLLAEHNQPASSIKVINPYNLTVLASDEVKLVKEFGCSTEDMLSSECSKLACFKMDLRSVTTRREHSLTEPNWSSNCCLKSVQSLISFCETSQHTS